MDSLYNGICSPFDWQNGVCDEGCNVKDCYWDGGDCNQLCTHYHKNCSINDMFENGICNEQCNSTHCSYDSDECIDQFTSSFNVSKWFNKNQTYCNINSNLTINQTYLCPISWINDDWCDENCRTSDECFHDANDCTCDETMCAELFSFFDHYSDYDLTTQDGELAAYISHDGFCAVWELIFNYYSDSLQNWLDGLKYNDRIDPTNCTTFFILVDDDNNNFVDFTETVNFVAGILGNFDNTAEYLIKSKQINCTSCLDSL